MDTKFKIELLDALFKDPFVKEEKSPMAKEPFKPELHTLIQEKFFQAMFGGYVRWTDKCLPSIYSLHHWRDFMPNRVFVREKTIFPKVDNTLGTIFQFVRGSQKRKAVVGFGFYHGRLKKIINKEDVMLVTVDSELRAWKGGFWGVRGGFGKD